MGSKRPAKTARVLVAGFLLHLRESVRCGFDGLVNRLLMVRKADKPIVMRVKQDTVFRTEFRKTLHLSKICIVFKKNGRAQQPVHMR